MFRGHLKMLIMHCLDEKRMSGYSLMKYLTEKTGQRPSPGALYPLLQAMAKEGVVSMAKSSKKKLYALTAKGKKLKQEMGDMKAQAVNALEQTMNLWKNLCDKEIGFHNIILSSIKRGEVPFNEIGKDLAAFRQVIAELHNNGKIRKKQKQIGQILRKACRQLRRI